MDIMENTMTIAFLCLTRIQNSVSGRSACFRSLLSLYMLCVLGTSMLSATTPRGAQAASIPHMKRQMGFVENKGQIVDQNHLPNAEVLFLAHQPGLNVQLRANSFSYDSYWDEESPRVSTNDPRLSLRPVSVYDPLQSQVPVTRHIHRVDIELVGAARSPHIRTELMPASPQNYYTAGCPESGIHSVRSMKRVVYENIYNNIDLEFFFGAESEIEYQFVVHPGGDVDDIRLRYHGARSIALNNGRIQLEVDRGVLHERIPRSYYHEDGSNVLVRYKLDGDEVSFRLPRAAKLSREQRTLIIDPTPSLNWATYYGGDTLDEVRSVCVDKVGNVFICGLSKSPDRIASSGAYQSTLASGTASDAFIAKFDRSGVRQWGSYFGGLAFDIGLAVCCDSSGYCYMVGHTDMSGGLASSTAFQPTVAGGFFVKWAPDGARSWSTYYGYDDVWLTSVCVDPQQNPIIAGYTSSTGTRIATPGSFQPSAAPAGDGFIAKFNQAGIRTWGSFFGSSATEQIFDVCTDLAGNIFASGYTNSTSGIAFGSSVHQSSLGGIVDAFLLKCSADGTSKLWATYYGGMFGDWGYAVQCDSSNSVYMVGTTASPNNISSSGSQQVTYGGGLYDVFLSKFNSSGQRQWATYCGGTQAEINYGGLSMDALQNPVLCGLAGGDDGVATSTSYQPNRRGGDDCFIQKYTPTGRRMWGSYYGGTADEIAYAVAADGLANMYMVGQTHSVKYIATPGAHQTQSDTTYRDGFLAKFWDCEVPLADVQSNENSSVCLGAVAQYYVTGASTNTYQWQSVRLGTYATGTNGQIAYIQWTKTGKDTVRMRETNNVTGCYRDTTMVITVYETPVITMSNTVSLCRGESIKLPAKVSGGNGDLHYLWSPSYKLDTVDSLTPRATPDSTIVYTLTVSDARGCISTANCSVTVYDKPLADAGKNISICAGTSLTLGTAAKKNCRYSWLPTTGLNNSAIAQPRATVNASTVYTVRVTNDSTHCIDSSTVAVHIYESAAQFAVSSLEFAPLGACEASHDTTITLTNTGADTLRFYKQSSSTADVQIIETLPLLLAPGESKEIRIRCSPTSQGQYNTQLSLTSKPCEYSVLLKASGTKANVALQSTLAQIDFGLHAVCDLTRDIDTVLTLYNRGTSTMTIESTVLTAPFSVIGANLPANLAIGDSLNLRVRYAASGSSSASAELKVAFRWASCIDTLRIAVQGRSLRPQILLASGSFIFNALIGCESNRDSVIYLVNGTDLPQTLDSIVGRNAEFNTTLSLPLIIPAHDSIAIPLRYSPSSNGTQNTQWNFVTEPCHRSLALQLSGTKSGFSIGAPDTVDLGTIASCQRDTLRTSASLSLSAQQQSSLVISSLDVSPELLSDLRLGDSLHSDKMKVVNLQYSPNAGSTVGTHYYHVAFEVQPCSIRREIVVKVRVTEQRPSIQALVDFGSIAALATHDTTVYFVNNGSAVLHVESLSTPSLPFSEISSSSSLPTDIKPGDSLGIHLRYAAAAQQQSDLDSISIHVTAPCAQKVVCTLRGQTSGTIDSATAIITLNDIVSAQGTSVAIALGMRSAKNFNIQGAPRNFRARIRFNHDLLYLVGMSPLCDAAQLPNCSVELSGTRGSGDTLALIPAKVTLGTTDTAPIELEDFQWTDGTVAHGVELQNGSIRVSGGCDEGGVRLFMPGHTSTSVSVRPNPVAGNAVVRVGLAEPSVATLELLNLQGQVVRSLLGSAQLAAGSHELTEDWSAIPNGIYLMKLSTQNYLLWTRVVVLH